MNKHRVNTTISSKHWEILKKHIEKFETQQKVLEVALECLENNSKQNPMISTEELNFLQAKGAMKSACIVHRDILRLLIDSLDLEKIRVGVYTQNTMEYLITHYYQKPLQKCSLKEILNGLVFFIRSGNIPESVNYTEEENYYILRIIHDLNHNCSKIFKFIIEDFFETYGAKTDIETSEKTVFIKIYKNFM